VSGARLLLAAALALAAAAAPGAEEPVARARAMLEALAPAAAAERYAATGRGFGELVDTVRAGDPDLATVQALRELAGRMQERARARVRALEAEAGEREAALERLYRSRRWETMSFALAAFPYWQAWLDLSAADRLAEEVARAAALQRAKRGFRAASVQIVHPGLVYGGWLGLCYVARAEGREGYARALLERLDEALARDPDHPLRETVQLELRLAKARAGEVGGDALASDEAQRIDEAEARLLALEAFALLDRHRREEVGAREAAARLKRLLAARPVHEALVARILDYREEILGYDIGPLGYLVSAEDALANEHFYTADEKYKAFFEHVPENFVLDLDRFRYRHAVAALRGGLLDDALGIVEGLLARRDPDPELRRAALELAYLAHARRYERTRGERDRRRLLAAAQAFVAASPGDPEADDARLAIAQVSDNPEVAASALGGLRAPSDRQEAVDDARFKAVAREFAAALEAGDEAAARRHARRGSRLRGDVLDDKQAPLETKALVIQMRTLLDERPQELLDAIASLSAREDLGPGVRAMLLWSQLRLLARPGREQALRLAFDELGKRELEPWQAEQAWAALRGMAGEARRAALARALLPGLARNPAIARRVELLLLEHALEASDPAAAHERSREFVERHPRSGEGWMLLARAAERAGALFDAEQAWATVTDNLPAGDPRWRRGMVKRLELRAASTRPRSACAILQTLQAYLDELSAEQRQAVQAAGAAADCSVRG